MSSGNGGAEIKELTPEDAAAAKADRARCAAWAADRPAAAAELAQTVRNRARDAAKEAAKVADPAAETADDEYLKKLSGEPFMRGGFQPQNARVRARPSGEEDALAMSTWAAPHVTMPAGRRRASGAAFGQLLLVGAATFGTLLAVAGCPATSRAASVAQNLDSGLVYVADAGESNRLTVTLATSHARMSDPGAVIRVGAGCRLVEPHTAECLDFNMSAELGDMNDAFDVVPEPGASGIVFADGGAGNDVLTGPPGTFAFTGLSGGPGDDLLIGGDSGDELDGGPGRDVMRGHGGNDYMLGADTPGAPERDDMDGGAGIDALSYRDRTAPVRVELRSGSSEGVAGETGEDDLIQSIEQFVGGRGDDQMLGNEQSNTFDGGPGADRLIGGDGDDTLTGGRDRDRVRGGHGTDELVFEGRRRSRDDASCGAGRHDRVRALAADDVPPPGCEYAVADDEFRSRLLVARLRPRRHARTVTFGVACQLLHHDREASTRVTGTITLREAAGTARLVGERNLGGLIPRCRRQAIEAHVPIRLTSLGRRLASRPQGVGVVVDVQSFNRLHWSVRLTVRP